MTSAIPLTHKNRMDKTTTRITTKRGEPLCFEAAADAVPLLTSPTTIDKLDYLLRKKSGERNCVPFAI